MIEKGLLAFGTILLGLISGPHQIGLMVSQPIRAVRLELDGQVAGTLTRPPWRTVIDFGEGLSPHKLEAIGLDENGAEITRTVQWLNLPRAEAELEVALERDREGRTVAVALAWAAVRPLEPERVSVTLDGADVPVASPRRIALPPLAKDELHVLRAQVTFPGGMSASATKAFGGVYLASTEAELTAVPILQKSGHKPPPPERIAGLLTAEGRPTQVIATERPLARVVVVFDARAVEAFREITVPPLNPKSGSKRKHWDRLWVRRLWSPPALGKDELDLLNPIPETVTNDGLSLYRIFTCNYFEEQSLDDLPVFLARRPVADVDPEAQWLPAAVAAAGINAARENRRRAVVLVLGTTEVDSDDEDPAEVRALLGRLHVPFHVWSPCPEVVAGETPWGSVRPITTLPELLEASKELNDGLERQFIAWIDGEHLPQSIALNSGHADFELAR